MSTALSTGQQATIFLFLFSFFCVIFRGIAR
eukprot:COSAG06_NODE_41279_length_393_cov_0.656463_1_plen_30_part_10